MAERVVSPGVFTNEIDQSFLPAAISNLGAALIGTCNKGPAFVPTVVSDYQDFQLKFGGLDPQHFLPYTAKSYLKNAGTATIVRVLGNSGYTAKKAVVIKESAAADGIPATASMTISSSADDDMNGQVNEGDFISLTVGSTVYKFIGETGVVPANASPNFYFNMSESMDGDYMASASEAIIAADIGFTAHTGSAIAGPFGHDPDLNQSASIVISASAVGASANDYVLGSGSNGTLGYFGTEISGTNAIAPSSGYFDFDGGTAATNATVFGALFCTASEYDSGNLTGTTIDDCNGGNATVEKFCIKFYDTYQSPTMSLQYGGTYPFIGDVLGESNHPIPESGDSYPGYVSKFFKSKASLATVTNVLGVEIIDSIYGAWASAKTPWVLSQTGSAFGDETLLFRAETLSAGDSSNREIKLAILNIKEAGKTAGSDYVHFDLVVRSFGDTDKRPVILETFANLNFDKDSQNYIVRKVGDLKQTYNTSTSKIDVTGEYTNISKYIRISDINSQIKAGTIGIAVTPWGFGSYSYPFTYTNDAAVEMPFRFNQELNGERNAKLYPGIAFDSGSTSKTGFAKDILPYLSATPSTAAHGSSSIFSLSKVTSGSSNDANVTFTSELSYRKFILGFQGGFDGYDTGYWGSGNTVESGQTNPDGSRWGLGHWRYAVDSGSHYDAIATVSNPDEIDINMVVTPGINKIEHSKVYDRVLLKAEDRADVFYPFDTGHFGSTISDVIGTSGVEIVDTNYAATYYPWVKIFDDENSKFAWVPPSVVIPGVIAFTDKIAHPWFAPAGLNRGGITEATMVKDRLTHEERDTLYEGRVNPIASFPGEGIVVWGQKTLQAKPSALDRVNVRRLLIKLKKFIASSSRYLVFEQNTNATRQRFLNIVNPFMESVQANSGLTAFRVVMDDTNNPPDVIDRNELRGSIFIQPARTAEFIVLDFVVLPTGATFPE